MRFKAVSEFYFRSDIQNGLRALDRATRMLAAGVPLAEVQLYRKAYHDALLAVAEMFNVTLEERGIEHKMIEGGGR